MIGLVLFFGGILWIIADQIERRDRRVARRRALLSGTHPSNYTQQANPIPVVGVRVCTTCRQTFKVVGDNWAAFAAHVAAHNS